MKLIINQQPVQVHEPADRTALEYLRGRRLTGTKEGCASGDCGACTIMVGELKDGRVRYKTVNACLVPIGQLAGTHLVTVEGLASDAGLHPVQEEMVTSHGSQCGFCTPGFVMSLAALLENGSPADVVSVQQGISGNLCRCTGYRPIVAAGVKALGRAYESRLQDPGPLAQIAQDDPASVLRPASEVELQQAMQDNPAAVLIAGGTDLMLEVTQRLQSFECLIDVSGVSELRLVSETADSIFIGAAVPYTELEQYFTGHSPQLVSLLHRLGSRQIRNSGTVGGNLANGSPIADMPPILIAWNAMIELVTTKGVSRQVSLVDFYTGYRQTVRARDEYIARIHIPKQSVAAFHRFYKSSKRIEDDISSVMGAFCFESTGDTIISARIAYGGMAATPVRLEQVEKMLTGRDLSPDLIIEACAAVDAAMTPLTDVRASASYRSAMARSMLERALAEFRGEARPVVMQVPIDA